MNIIELVKSILSNYSEISKFTNDIAVDFLDNSPANFGLYSTGDELVKEDILGNPKRRHSFVLYANKQSYTDYDRLCNSNFLLDLNYWLETQKGQEIIVEIDNKTITGELIKLSSANGMLFNIPTGNLNDGVTYQLQIYADYTYRKDD